MTYSGHMAHHLIIESSFFSIKIQKKFFGRQSLGDHFRYRRCQLGGMAHNYANRKTSEWKFLFPKMGTFFGKISSFLENIMFLPYAAICFQFVCAPIGVQLFHWIAASVLNGSAAFFSNWKAYTSHVRHSLREPRQIFRHQFSSCQSPRIENSTAQRYTMATSEIQAKGNETQEHFESSRNTADSTSSHHSFSLSTQLKRRAFIYLSYSHQCGVGRGDCASRPPAKCGLIRLQGRWCLPCLSLAACRLTCSCTLRFQGSHPKTKN